MNTYFVNFSAMTAEVEAAIYKMIAEQETQRVPPSAISDRVRKYMAKALQEPTEQILFDVISAQNLTQIHKKQYYDSFNIKIQEAGIEIVFQPQEVFIGMLENGAPEADLKALLLRSNYKIMADGAHKYRVIPLQTKDAIPGAMNFAPKVFTVEPNAEENLFRDLTALVGDKEKKIEMASHGGTSKVRYWRTESILYRTEKGFKRGRVYLSEARGHKTSVVSRFTTFRTISDNPDRPSGRWKNRPAIEPLKLAETLVEEYTTLVKNLDKYLAERISEL